MLFDAKSFTSILKTKLLNKNESEYTAQFNVSKYIRMKSNVVLLTL